MHSPAYLLHRTKREKERGGYETGKGAELEPVAHLRVRHLGRYIWEHMKIVFWPLLVGLTMLYDKGKWGSVLLSVLLCCGLMLAFGWGCHVGLGLAPGFVDIVCYVLLMALGCLLPDWLKVPEGWTGWLICATILLVGLLITFTIMPPDLRCVLGGCVGGTYLVTKEDKIDKGTDGGFVQFVDEAALLSGGRG